MFRITLAGVLLALLAAPALADEPAVKAKAQLPVRFPVLIQPDTKPAPQPAPVVGASAALKAGELYVVEADTDNILLFEPEGVFEVQSRPGPLAIFAPFYDGKGTAEFREYKSKFVHVIKVTAGKTDGEATLFVIPVGVKDKKEILKQSLTTGKPGPKPDVTPEKTQLVKDLQKAYDACTEPDKAATLTGLIAVYSYGRDTAVNSATWGEMFSSMGTVASNNKVAGKAMDLQLVIQKQLSAALPSAKASKTPVDAAGKELAKQKFNEIAVSLSQVK